MASYVFTTLPWLRLGSLRTLADTRYAMLTTAALVNSEEDVRGYYNDEDVNMNIGNDTISPERHRENALQVQAAREMRRNLDVGGKRDASTMRTQATYLCSDFEMYATNKSTTFPLSGALQDKVGLRSSELCLRSLMSRLTSPKQRGPLNHSKNTYKPFLKNNGYNHGAHSSMPTSGCARELGCSFT